MEEKNGVQNSNLDNNKSSQKHIVIIILVLLLLALVFGFVYYNYIKKDDKPIAYRTDYTLLYILLLFPLS